MTDQVLKDKLAYFREFAATSKLNQNYHLREMSPEEFRGAAQKSYDRLPPAQKVRVQKSWTDLLSSVGETLTEESVYELIEFRFLAQTNLFFLCHLLEKYNQVTLKTHEDICNKFFVGKDPRFATLEHFANDYTDLKDRMLLVPRGGFKSSIDMADCVQWIICFPAITILILTGTLLLATDFVGEIKQHFTFEETGQLDQKTGKMIYGPRKLQDKKSGQWSSSLFQVLFPEHCTPPGDGKQTEFQTPAGGDEKEPTIRAASIEQALSGAHFGILKLDDVVTNENSLTPDRLLKTIKQISINRAMMHPYGFMDVIGTWYDEKDYYGETIRNEEGLAVEEGRLDCIVGSVDSGRFNSSVHSKIYLRAAWWFTEQAMKEGRIEAEAKKLDYELWFPERLTYEFLIKEKKTEKSVGGFEIKYLNNPRKINRIKLPRELLVRRTIPHSQLPPQGIVVTTVDTAYSTKDWADYTVILTAYIYGGRFYIINMVRGRFNEYELPAVIAATANKWKPKRIAIEDSVGVRWMGRELKREMDKFQIAVPVEFVNLGFGTKTKAKSVKFKPVVRLIGDERMYFLGSCEGLQEIYSELEQFTGTTDDKHDDIVSALSLLVEVFGAYADIGAKVNFAEMQFVGNRQAQERHNLIYGMGKYAKYNAANDDNPTTAFQMQSDRKFQDDTDTSGIDPLASLMS